MKVLLYSGGMDSWLIKKLWKPDLSLYVGTGSKYSRVEQRALERNKETDVEPISFLNLKQYEREDFIIPYRNVYLCLAALNEVERRFPLEQMEEDQRIVQICLGATAGDRVLDKSPEFAEKLSDLLTYLSAPQHWTGGKSQRVAIVLPYKNCTKRQLLEMYCEEKCIVEGLTVQEAMKLAWYKSFSCYTPRKDVPCGKCKACARKTVAFVLSGYNEFPIKRYALLARQYFEESGILKQIEDGTYGRAEEEKDILEFMEATKYW